MTEENDDLLAELNGAAATPQEASELAAQKEAAVRDPLIVKPAPKQSAAKRAEEKMKTAAGDNPLRGYAVTVAGYYSAPSVDTPGRKVKCPYTLTVNLPSLEGALSTIKHKLLDKMLKMKYTNYVTFLTHEIVDVKPLTADTPESNNVAYMSADALLSFIRHRNVPIDVNTPAYDNGRDIRGIRAAVVDFLTNPKDFGKREEKRLAAAIEDKALAALNPEIEAEVVK